MLHHCNAPPLYKNGCTDAMPPPSGAANASENLTGEVVRPPFHQEEPQRNYHTSPQAPHHRPQDPSRTGRSDAYDAPGVRGPNLRGPPDSSCVVRPPYTSGRHYNGPSSAYQQPRTPFYPEWRRQWNDQNNVGNTQENAGSLRYRTQQEQQQYHAAGGYNGSFTNSHPLSYCDNNRIVRSSEDMGTDAAHSSLGQQYPPVRPHLPIPSSSTPNEGAQVPAPASSYGHGYNESAPEHPFHPRTLREPHGTFQGSRNRRPPYRESVYNTAREMSFNSKHPAYPAQRPLPKTHEASLALPTTSCDPYATGLTPYAEPQADYHVSQGRGFRYVEHPDVAKMTQNEVEELYRSLQIFVSGGQPPKPLQRFEYAPFPDWVQTELQRAGYAAPYPIQAVGWPVALSGRDMIGIARTGSGKTLAYLIPSFFHIQLSRRLRRREGPSVLVLAPTRELAMQIEKEAQRFVTPSSPFSITCIFGGVPRRGQASDLQRGVHLCIATPGRLIDFLDTGTTRLDRVTYLVLDEADRMLDMGFEPQIRRILSHITSDHQTLMWSATWPREVQNLARDFCRCDPIKLTVGAYSLQANENIQQLVYVCSTKERFQLLVERLISQQDGCRDKGHSGASRKKTLVFCETKRGCDQLRQQLLHVLPDLKVAAIHGDKEQRERDRILFEFKTGRCVVLIATDVASRGLDIKNMDVVINYDVPKTIEDYIHRIGRTGRAGASGTALTFFTDAVADTERTRMAHDICSVMRDVNQEPPEALVALTTRVAGRGYRSSQGRRYYTPRKAGGSFYPRRPGVPSSFRLSYNANNRSSHHSRAQRHHPFSGSQHASMTTYGSSIPALPENVPWKHDSLRQGTGEPVGTRKSDRDFPQPHENQPLPLIPNFMPYGVRGGSWNQPASVPHNTKYQRKPPHQSRHLTEGSRQVSSRGNRGRGAGYRRDRLRNGSRDKERPTSCSNAQPVPLS